MKQKQPSYNRNFIPEYAKAHQMQLTLKYTVRVFTIDLTIDYKIKYSHTNNGGSNIQFLFSKAVSQYDRSGRVNNS